MKTLKAMLIAVVLLFVAGTAGATSNARLKPTKEDVFNVYLNAVVHGKLANINDVIDDDAEFNFTRGENVNKLNKQQMINSLKSSENIEQNCHCTKTVLQDSEDMSTLKVEMKFGDFSRVDVITAQHAGKAWKITKVDISFK